MPPRGNLPANSPMMSTSAVGRLVAQGRDRAVTAPKSLLGPSKEDLIDENDPDIEDFGPPGWRTVLNSRVDLGYPDFYPSRPGFNQIEDVLTEENIKNGFSARSFVAVGAESFSMHGPIHAHLQNGCLTMLNRLGNEMLQKRDDSMPQFAERSFRIPPRVTYNDVKRQAFLSDLGNMAIPLSRLMRQPVPHGFKGVEMLESMYSPVPPTRPGAAQLHFRADPIPLERALWFIRVLGANEIIAHRARITATGVNGVSVASPAATTPGASMPGNDKIATSLPIDSNEWYTSEFTNIFTQWMRIQLNQLSLPVLPGSTTVAPLKPVGVLGDSVSRSKWLSKWDYTTTMLASLTTQNLISPRLLSGFLTDFLSMANLAQTGFVLRLLCDRVQDLSNHLTLGRHCLIALLEKAEEISASPARDALSSYETLTHSLVTSLVRANQDVAMSPILWRYHEQTLDSIIGRHMGQLQSVKERSLQLLLTQPDEATGSKRVEAASEAAKLDSISSSTDMSALSKAYFDAGASASAAVLDLRQLESKVDTLLNWANDLFKLGSHRPYAAQTLLRRWLDDYEASRPQSSKRRNTPPFDLFPILFNWLDTSAAAKQESNASAIGITFGEFTRQGLFSYGRYLRTLVALDHTARSREGMTPSHHLALLAAMPIFVEAKDLLHQRRLALSGDSADQRRLDDQEEEQTLAQYKERIKEYLPEVFGMISYGRSEMLRDLRDFGIEDFHTMTRHLFLQSRFWLIPRAQEALAADMSASTFARCVHLFCLTKGLSTLGDFLCHALKVNSAADILQMTIDSIRTYANAWTAMDRWPRIISALIDRLLRLEKAGKYSPPLMVLLRDLAVEGRLSDDDEEELALVEENHRNVGVLEDRPWSDAAESMDAIIGAIASASEPSAVTLASKLFSRHGPLQRWGALWWDTIIRAVRRLAPAATLAAQTAVAHILRVNELARDEVDRIIHFWGEKLESSSRLALLSAQSTSSLISVLLGLVAHRCLSARTILSFLVLPVWADISVLLPKRIPIAHIQALEASLVLTEQLLLDAPPAPHLPPMTLSEAQIFQTTRADLLRDDWVPTLLRSLPLLVSFRLSRGLPAGTATHIDTLFRELSCTTAVKVALIRHATLLKDAFMITEKSNISSVVGIEEAMASTSRLLLSKDAPPPTPVLNMPYSPIELKQERRASHGEEALLEMGLELKSLGKLIDQGDGASGAFNQLEAMLRKTFDSELAPQDLAQIYEMFVGLSPVLSSKCISIALDKVNAILAEVVSTDSTIMPDHTLRHALQLVLMIDNACSRDSKIGSEGSISNSRAAFIRQMTGVMTVLENKLTDGPEALPIGGGQNAFGSLLHLGMSCLKFLSSFKVGNPQTNAAPRSDILHLCCAYIRVLAYLPRQAVHQNDDVIDLLAAMIDMLPSMSRSVAHGTLLASLLSADVRALLLDVPRLRQAFPYLPFGSSNLVVEAQSNADSHYAPQSLDSRPWEMFDRLTPVSSANKRAGKFLAERPLVDLSSIPISAFKPTFTRDAVGDAPFSDDDVEDTVNDDTETPLANSYLNFSSERNIGNGMAGEPTSAKEITTSAYAGPPGLDMVSARSTSISPHVPLEPLQSPTVDETALPVRRRSSSRLAQKGSGSNADPITIDEEGEEDEASGDSGKEEGTEDDKRTEASERDNEEDIDAPLTKRARTGSKASVRPMTGGKAPAKSLGRSTTGGKNVGRKGVGGKAPRKGRK